MKKLLQKGAYQYSLKVVERLVFSTVTNHCKEGQKRCGVCLPDKSFPDKENSFSVEILTKFSSDSNKLGKSIKQYIDETLVSILKIVRILWQI